MNIAQLEELKAGLKLTEQQLVENGEMIKEALNKNSFEIIKARGQLELVDKLMELERKMLAESRSTAAADAQETTPESAAAPASDVAAADSTAGDPPPEGVT